MTTKPHIYRFNNVWWVSRNGHQSLRRGITLNDSWWPYAEDAFAAASFRWKWELRRAVYRGWDSL